MYAFSVDGSLRGSVEGVGGAGEAPADVDFFRLKAAKLPANPAHFPGEGLHLCPPVLCRTMVPSVMLMEAGELHIFHLEDSGRDLHDLIEGQAAFVDQGGDVRGDQSFGGKIAVFDESGDGGLEPQPHACRDAQLLDRTLDGIDLLYAVDGDPDAGLDAAPDVVFVLGHTVDRDELRIESRLQGHGELPGRIDVAAAPFPGDDPLHG